jgi:hypothetical protein
MAKYIELSAEETINITELIGKALDLPLDTHDDNKEDDNGCN